MPSVGPMFLPPFVPNPRLDQLPPSWVDGISIRVLRLDLIDQLISGNKWYKLRYYLQEAKEKALKVVTYGGAWSNHILATAVACQRMNIPCAGIIRGEKPVNPSATLLNAINAGMELVFVSRSEYADKILPARFHGPGILVIPEGGYGPTGARGAATILDQPGAGRFTHCFCAVGTGTMMAGLINALLPGQRVTGIPVLNDSQLVSAVSKLVIQPKGITVQNDNQLISSASELVFQRNDSDIGNSTGTGPGNYTPDLKENLQIYQSGNWELINGFEFGGYARYRDPLIRFMNDFYRQTSIPTDFVYTGKLFYAVKSLLRTGWLPRGSEVLVVHSGGIQGNAGLPSDSLIF
ncbi:MAG: pyridoxal-phosphate dependent enzyme [Chitinophagaceae bacterium]